MSGYTSSQVMNLLSELQSTDLPGALHRVQHPGSQGASDHFGNLKARPSSTSLESVSEFRVALANHLQWGYSTSLSCFLSVFDERKLAEDWARTRYERAQSNRSLTSDTTTLHSISTEHLQHTIVFPVSTLLSCFGMKSNRDITHELLIVDQIPARAITGQTDIGSLVGQELEDRAEAEQWRLRPKNPQYHWVDDLHGYYDTDEECEEHNRNDDLMRAYEDNMFAR